MHLLQSGVDITVIALWLGHEDTATTHMYVEADLTMKEQALVKLQPAAASAGRFRASDKLMSFSPVALIMLRSSRRARPPGCFRHETCA